MQVGSGWAGRPMYNAPTRLERAIFELWIYAMRKRIAYEWHASPIENSSRA